MLLILGVVLSAAAQMLLKFGVSELADGLPAMLRVIGRWQVMLGAVLYVLAFLIYLQVLARFDLSYASPVMVRGVVMLVLVLVLVLVAGAVMGEAVGPMRLIGALLIVAGMALLSVEAGG